MKKRSSKEPSQLGALGAWVDRLVAFGFALGVIIILGLFVYFLFTQFIGKG